MYAAAMRTGYCGRLQCGKSVISSYSRIHQHRRKFETSCKEVAIPTAFGNIAGKWWGPADIQPMIAIHGWEDNASSFDELAPLLNTSVLAIDLPGHGYSSHAPLGTTYNFMDGVTLIRQLVKHFKWDNVTIMGHSYGSNLAFTYSAFFPNNVKNLIGIECVRAEITQKVDNVAQGLRHAIDSALYVEERLTGRPPAYSLDEMTKMLMSGSKGPISEKCCEILLKRGAKKADSEGKYLFARDPRLKALPLGRLTDDMLFSCSERITCNVLQLFGDPGWNVHRSEAFAKTVQLMTKNAKRYESHLVKGTHHLHLDSPDRVAPIVREFIKTM